MTKEFVTLKLSDIKPYPNNPRRNDDAVKYVVKSIEECENLDPIEIDENNVILSGHTRLKALQQLGYAETECIRYDGLTEEQKKKYRLLANKTGEFAEWDNDLLPDELADLDFDGFDFEFEATSVADWFDRAERDGANRQDGNDEYNEFVEKFEPKKTTDDCYTPEIVYDAIADFVAKEYGLNRKNFVRPFYPGGDYENQKYKDEDVVVDNPPFSILAQIINYYAERGIKFFLFAPTLTLFSSSASSSSCSLPCGGKITYENGAVVPTSFVTNLEDNRVHVIPELYRLIEAADEENQKQFKKTLPKYKYPDEVLTAAMCRYMCEHDTPFVLKKEDSYHLRQLDSQKEYNDSAIFGSGFLLSEKAAAEKAAAEKAAAEKAAAEKAAAKVWELSEREKEIVRQLSGGD